jgi:putative hydrolase of the HAD superfamily
LREPRPSDPVVFIDADDTLWENAIFFRAARKAWRDFMASRGHDARRARDRLREVEDEGLARREFGSVRLGRNMKRVAAEFETQEELDRDVLAACEDFVRSIRQHPIQFYPGALETLAELRRRHPLIMLTMGEHDEQVDKIERSGIADRFDAIEIVPDKNATIYRELHERYRTEADGRSWMIGNSPSKDIGPAAAAEFVTVLFRNGAPLPPYFEAREQRPADHTIDALSDLLEIL